MNPRRTAPTAMRDVGPRSRRPRLAQVLAGIILVQVCVLSGMLWKSTLRQQHSGEAAAASFRDRLIRWRQARQTHQSEVRKGSRLPLVPVSGEGTRASGPAPRRTLLLFVGDTAG